MWTRAHKKKTTKQSLLQKVYFPSHEEVTAGRERGENRNKNNSKLKRQVTKWNSEI